MTRFLFSKITFLGLLFLTSLASAQLVTRPPQFVMLAFDNCQENQTWEQVSQFLDQMNAQNKDNLHFTFFLSAVGLMTDHARQNYTDPLGRTGKSNIGFGGSDEMVLKRIAWINKLRANGNEIASHAVGHFSGKDWTIEQWRHELAEYNYILDNIAEINGFKGEQAARARLDFSSKDLMGFRAPYLDGGDRLNQVLMEDNYVYDTSDTNQGYDLSTWPHKLKNSLNQQGLWNFGLGFLNVELTRISEKGLAENQPRILKMGKVPAMDYNFCYVQTGGCPNKDPFAVEQDQDAGEMLKAYLGYFVKNYNGNRAPLNIGHHFEQYRGGSYNRSLFKFAKTVCSLPEVRCVTYHELADYLERVGPQVRDQMQAGRFARGPELRIENLLN